MTQSAPRQLILKPFRILAVILAVILASSLILLFNRRDGGDVVSGTWVGRDEDDVWTFYDSGEFLRVWEDDRGRRTAAGHYRIENGADLYVSGEDEDGLPFSEKFYFIIYHGDEMKLSSRWYLKK